MLWIRNQIDRFNSNFHRLINRRIYNRRPNSLHSIFLTNQQIKQEKEHESIRLYSC